MHALRNLDGAPTVARLADDLDLVVGLEDAAQPLAYDGMIVDQQDPNLTHEAKSSLRPIHPDSQPTAILGYAYRPSDLPASWGPISPHVGRSSQEVFQLGDPLSLGRERAVPLCEEACKGLDAGLVVPERRDFLHYRRQPTVRRPPGCGPGPGMTLPLRLALGKKHRDPSGQRARFDGSAGLRGSGGFRPALGT
jgi:hypothetical protein